MIVLHKRFHSIIFFSKPRSKKEHLPLIVKMYLKIILKRFNPPCQNSKNTNLQYVLWRTHRQTQKTWYKDQVFRKFIS